MPLAGGPLVAKITKDSREDEMEDNMQQVNSMIGNLKVRECLILIITIIVVNYYSPTLFYSLPRTWQWIWAKK